MAFHSNVLSDKAVRQVLAQAEACRQVLGRVDVLRIGSIPLLSGFPRAPCAPARGCLRHCERLPAPPLYTVFIPQNSGFTLLNFAPFVLNELFPSKVETKKGAAWLLFFGMLLLVS